MVISDFLSPADVLVGVQATDKTGLLRDLSIHAASALGLGRDAIAGELLKREALGSTGIGGGVAIPHAHMAELRKPYGILARLRAPIDFNSIDEKRVDIVFVLLSPASLEAQHLSALACIARKLRDPSAIGAIRAEATSAAVYRAVTT